MKVLKVRYYKKRIVRGVQHGSVRCSIDEFTVEQLKDAKRLIEFGISTKQSKDKQENESCDDCIFIKKDKISKLWDVLRTTKDYGRTATVMFSFHTRKKAYRAGSWIAFAIDGKFWGETDPRDWRASKNRRMK